MGTSHNKWICGFATLRSNLLHSVPQTSHIPGTLGDIAERFKNIVDISINS